MDNVPGKELYGIALLGGDYVVKTIWLNLDSDSDLEFVCVSRSGGTGPYYHGVIIDHSQEIFTFRSFYSFGSPEIDPKKRIIRLGEDKNDPNLSESSKVATYIDYIWDKGLRLSKKHR